MASPRSSDCDMSRAAMSRILERCLDKREYAAYVRVSAIPTRSEQGGFVMERETRRSFEQLRRRLGPVQNQVINDLNDGEFVDRQEFFRRASVLGLSASA